MLGQGKPDEQTKEGKNHDFISSALRALTLTSLCSGVFRFLCSVPFVNVPFYPLNRSALVRDAFVFRPPCECGRRIVVSERYIVWLCLRGSLCLIRSSHPFFVVSARLSIAPLLGVRFHSLHDHVAFKHGG